MVHSFYCLVLLEVKIRVLAVLGRWGGLHCWAAPRSAVGFSLSLIMQLLVVSCFYILHNFRDNYNLKNRLQLSLPSEE